MPIYEYKCEECQEEFEELVLSSKDVQPVCPRCGSDRTKKKVSLFGSIGSGGSSCGSSGFT